MTMALTVNSNIASLNAQRNLGRSTTGLQRSMERLSSGMRINRAGDDAAGMAISEGLRSQVRGLNQAVRNANDGLSMIAVGESAMNTYTDILQRIRELAIQSANDTNSTANRKALNEEAQQLLGELQRIAVTTEFNGTRLFDGTFIDKQLQAGAQANQTIDITTGDLRTSQIGKVTKITTTALPTNAAPLGTGELLINGIDISPTLDDGVSWERASSSAIAVANAINAQTNLTGVKARVLDTTWTGFTVAGSGGAPITLPGEQITINGVAIFDQAETIQANDGDGVLRNAINAKSNQTGVVATLNASNELVLTARDGRNISIDHTGTVGNEFGLAAAAANVDVSQGGTIELVSQDNVVVGGTTPGYAGLTAGTSTPLDNTAVQYIDLMSAVNANLAVDIADNALEQINEIRSTLGAITNRLDLTMRNLETIAENLAASDSRIRDADFAKETAEMTKNQILQQAGIAVLGQANTTTQSALQLLQG